LQRRILRSILVVRLKSVTLLIKIKIMRTTLDIDDDVLAAAIELACGQKTTAGKIISALARMALSGPHPTGQSSRRDLSGYNGEGSRRMVSDEVK
jgi:hypothetical protein